MTKEVTSTSVTWSDCELIMLIQNEQNDYI